MRSDAGTVGKGETIPRTEHRDSFQTFTRSAAPSCSATLLLVAPQNPLPAGGIPSESATLRRNASRRLNPANFLLVLSFLRNECFLYGQ
jgi:hypothetical protein